MSIHNQAIQSLVLKEFKNVFDRTTPGTQLTRYKRFCSNWSIHRGVIEEMYRLRAKIWRPTTMIKRSDNLKASDFTKQVAHHIHDEREVNMFDLLSMEYAREWHRKVHETKLETSLRTEDQNYLLRRYIIRGMLVSRQKRKPKKLFKMKKFENVPARIDTNIRKQKMKILTKGMTDEEKNEILEEAKNETAVKQRGNKYQKTIGE